MTEEPAIFGEAEPFALVHAEDLGELTRFLAGAGVVTLMAPAGPSLYKIRFMDIAAQDARELMRQLIQQAQEGVRQEPAI